jgi:pyruvate-ferredoxin/flavodoxin oxidoreductase
MDGNEACAHVAYRMSESVAIYPITPSTPMGELADEWAARGKKNLWGSVPGVTQMQSEAGVAGALHGMLQAGSFATTFTASQGLLLMIPILYKLAGQLLPCCLHVTARTIATHALSIFGDHSDIMAIRQTGVALLGSTSVQEAHDLAAIAHAATLRTRIPFVHFFDGFRTSHEINDVELLPDQVLRALVDQEASRQVVSRALTPDHPVIRGTAQNPDAFFQAREAANPFYDAAPGVVQDCMDRFAELTGRQYSLFEYYGDPGAENVIVVMGSGAETVRETMNALNAGGARLGLVLVRLYRPFAADRFSAALPATVRRIAVLDRTKEPGAVGDPLYLDVVGALRETMGDKMPQVFGGRFGLASKEFTPSMVRGVYGELAAAEPRRHFSVGIKDDITNLSVDYDPDWEVELPGVTQAVFFGLGSDGTVGANKNTIKIISEETGCHAQAYFVYDSKKSGGITISHLRFGSDPIRAPYLVTRADFTACHQWHLLGQYDILEMARPGGIFLLNSPHSAAAVWEHLDCETQAAIIEKKLRVHVIDAYKVAREAGMGGRINTIMQVCFFALSGILPVEEAIAAIKNAITRTYGKKGREIVERNHAAVDQTLEGLEEVIVPSSATTERHRAPVVPDEAPDFVRSVEGVLLAGKGDWLPVSAFPPDGTWPTGTSKWEKRNLAQEIPAWDDSICIQCNKCVLVCPHAAIRAKHYPEEALEGAPPTFLSMAFRSPELKGHRYTIQIAPEDCTGCRLCVNVCPAKNKTNPKHKALNLVSQLEVRDAERENFSFFLRLPEPDRQRLKTDVVKDTQFLEPLFEFSGACVGCGETPYLKLLSQLHGDRAVIANATGCSSIYGGNLPTTPYTTNAQGRGPAWANSLFEDNAEFGLGLRLGLDRKRDLARQLLGGVGGLVGDDLVAAILAAEQLTEAEIAGQRERVSLLKEKLATSERQDALDLRDLADYLVEKVVWIVGGDGWAYDIGFGGLDHVLSLGANINILVLDTEVYSNTGGQQSKSTQIGAVAKFAAGGKSRRKKDLGLHAINYGDVYVARVAFGAKDSQTVKAFHDAVTFPGTSLIIAYSHCIAHGYNMANGLDQQKLAVESGYWPIYRHDPRRHEAGENPFVLDANPPKIPVERFTENEVRYRLLGAINPERARELRDLAQTQAEENFKFYQQLAKVKDVPAFE